MFSAVGVGVRLPILLLLVTRFPRRVGKVLLVFLSCWCRRYAADFTAVGAAFDTTAGVNAPRFLAVGVGVMLPNFPVLVPPFALRRG